MRRAFTDAAVGDDVVGLFEPLLLLINRPQRVCVLEAPVGVGRSRPRHATRALDVTAAQRTLLWVVGHVRALSGELFGRPHINQRFATRRMVTHLLKKGADLFVGTLWCLVPGFRKARYIGIHR